MGPLELAARFGAFAWYIENRQASSPVIEEEAQRFADENWQAFLAVANEGWGRLLNEIMHSSRHRHRRPAAARRSWNGTSARAKECRLACA
jgi:hypothetical protein